MYNYTENKPELLSPVGNQESLLAAISNGCDAVYLGGKAFNARRRADNFDLEELGEAIEYAHLREVEVYLTVNTLYKDDELADVVKFIKEVYKLGIDAIIVQDLGLARLVNQVLPNLELHASTQLTVHNLEGVKYLESLGFSRVVLARELTLTEIEEIVQNTELEIETFVHGALCVSYSGQCLLSSMIGGRSGNRGLCAQPCRLPYTLVDLETEEVINDEFAKQHLLSPKDINTLELIPDLIEAGISSFKIEGRMKRPEYVAVVTENYRNYIDQYFNQQGNFVVDNQDQKEVKQLFNRNGFIPGYYLGKENLELISYQRPKNWGVKIGEVIAYDQQSMECRIKLERAVKEGDGIEIWTEEGRNPGLTLSEPEKLTDELLVVKTKGQIKPGDLVYRTSQKELLDRLQESYQDLNQRKKIEVFGHLSAQLDQPLQLNLWDQAGHHVTVKSDFYPERAKKEPVTIEKIKEQLTRLGSTPYQLLDLGIELDKNIFIPVSKLNQLRQLAVERLNEKRLKEFLPTEDDLEIELPKLENKLPTSDKPKLSVCCNKRDHLTEIASLSEVDRIYYEIGNLTDQEILTLVDQIKTEVEELFIKFPRVARQQEMIEFKQKVELLEETAIDGYLVSQLGMAELLTKTNKKLIADYPLNNFNSYTVNHWQQKDYQTVTLSPELNLKEIKEITANSQIETEVVVYGYLPVMVSEYCPIGAVNKGFDSRRDCNQDCVTKRKYGLMDRKDYIFPITTDCTCCRSTIYNCYPVYVLDYLPKIVNTGCEFYRLDINWEEKEEVIKIIKNYYQKINNPEMITEEMNLLNYKFKKEGYTTGHFNRGVE
ncbi:DUF3656 domain-containing protein [Natroniella sulfidigena]|uniref:DUF3656 domain-containing U32 family peptidase n=1 Tax=Natroniella sulfidigena TaxID=723921 RepID=UPI00200B441F|nr:U32 family peptidase [Natroniella sulfidigena]MCK8817240.1 DUF3656 domain-containing protein [Natroniella sulfidigena]